MTTRARPGTVTQPGVRSGDGRESEGGGGAPQGNNDAAEMAGSNINKPPARGAPTSRPHRKIRAPQDSTASRAVGASAAGPGSAAAAGGAAGSSRSNFSTRPGRPLTAARK